jgi:hypothetical protein
MIKDALQSSMKRSDCRRVPSSRCSLAGRTASGRSERESSSAGGCVRCVRTPARDPAAVWKCASPARFPSRVSRLAFVDMQTMTRFPVPADFALPSRIHRAEESRAIVAHRPLLHPAPANSAGTVSREMRQAAHPSIFHRGRNIRRDRYRLREEEMRALPTVLINGRVSAPRRSVPADLSAAPGKYRAPGILSMAFHAGAPKGGIQPRGQLRRARGGTRPRSLARANRANPIAVVYMRARIA